MQQLFASHKFRRFAIQAGFVIVAILILLSLVLTGQRNIADQGIATGFGFLERTTGWPMNFSVIEVTGRSTYARVLWAGLLNTMLVGFMTLIFATVLGLLLALMRVSTNTVMKLVGATYVEIFRNVPVILQVFFWYAILTHLPSPRAAYAVNDVIFLSNRGLMLPAPMLSASDLWLLAAALAAGTFNLWRARAKPGTGRRWALVLVSYAVLFVLLLVTGRAPDAPLVSVPELKGLRYVGGIIHGLAGRSCPVRRVLHRRDHARRTAVSGSWKAGGRSRVGSVHLSDQQVHPRTARFPRDAACAVEPIHLADEGDDRRYRHRLS